MTESKISRRVAWVVVALCGLPLLLGQLGIQFDSPPNYLDWNATAPLGASQRAHAAYESLAAAFVHTILEWSAVCIAIFTVFLAFIHFSLKRDVTTPVIGVALLCAASMDAFHTLAADRLIEVAADIRRFLPYTWAVGRVFTAAIMIVGVAIFLVRGQKRTRGGIGLVIGVSLAFGFVAYGVIRFCATSALPATMFPESLVTRPWDIAPLVLFSLMGVFLYPRFYRMNPNLFTQSLLISTIPNVAAQMHMVFGSTALFDHHFNIAHFLKVISYVVPLTGLALDYVRTYLQERSAVERFQEANMQLARRNTELDEFTYVASHDLQEPLRKLIAFSALLKSDAEAELPAEAKENLGFISEAARRMQTLVQDLLALSRTGRTAMRRETVSLNLCAEHALAALALQIKETGAVIHRQDLPEVTGDSTLLSQVYQNLISNALKFTQDSPTVTLTADEIGGRTILGVKDNGIGIDREFGDQVFAPFKRLHGQAAYPGTGVGLSICRKVVQRHGGQIWVESAQGTGSHFKFTLDEVKSDSEPE